MNNTSSPIMLILCISVEGLDRTMVPWNPEVFSLKNEIEAKRKPNLRVHTLGHWSAPIHSEATIGVSETDFHLEARKKRLLIRSAHSKDLTCAPGGWARV